MRVAGLEEEIRLAGHWAEAREKRERRRCIGEVCIVKG